MNDYACKYWIDEKTCTQFNKQLNPNICNWCKGDPESFKRLRDKLFGGNPKLPPVSEQAKSFIQASFKQAVAGFPKRSDAEVAVIQAICRKCQNYLENNGRARCAKCGCFLSVKERWETADCPAGKWPSQKKNERVIFPQPSAHPARWKKIFMRADGSLVDLIDLFHGQSAFLCCGGPSFATVDKRLFEQPGIVSMAVNNTAHQFRPTLWTAQDPQYRFMPSIWEDPKIMKFTLWDYRRGRYWLPKENRYGDRTLQQCPNLFFHKRKSDLNAATWLDEDRIVWGTPKELDDGSHGARSVFLAALHILYFLGFWKIYLVGVDFYMDAKNKYWFDEHRGPAAIRNNQRVYEQTAEHCKNLRPYLEKAGFNVFNCNPNSHLKAFEFYPLQKAIDENTIDTSDSTEGMYVKR